MAVLSLRQKKIKHWSSSSCLASVIEFRAKAALFKLYMFTDELVNSVSSLTWWQSQSDNLNLDIMLSRVASSAAVERVFSSFGFVQSKVRNRLDTEKVGKLMFMYKLLNGKHD